MELRRKVSALRQWLSLVLYLRLDGGGAADDGISSSGSRDRLRRLRLLIPRFAEDILERKGELKERQLRAS